jgi:hypothetical protein
MRLGAAVVAMQVAALLLAVWAFGAVGLVAGAPLVVATVLVLALVRLSRGPLRRLEERRSARWEHDAPEPGGLMSGFFEAPAPQGR